MNLADSLNLYETHLRNILTDKDTFERFLNLKNATEIGCYCTPPNNCHTDIILKILGEYLPNSKSSLPKRRCLKVQYLRKDKYDNLKEWLAEEGHVMCTRQGRIWITENDGDDKKRYIFHYPNSEWCNPYKIK